MGAFGCAHNDMSDLITNEMAVGHALRLTGIPLGLCAKGIFKFDSAIHKAD